MKRILAASLVLCLVIAGGTFVYRGQPDATPVPTTRAEPTAVEPASQSAESPTPKPAPPQPVAAVAVTAAQPPAQAAAVSDEKADGAVRPTALSRRLDLLVSPQSTFQDKQSIWWQLQNAGEMNQAITELKQRATGNPNDPQVATALGEAELFKLRTVEDFNERGLLALQADQSFNSALKNEPTNWEAQYYKASSMSYWPADLHKGDEVVQRLSNLVDQQETMPPQPQFARTYVVLGEQFQKMGQSDYAQQTWRLGATKFPNDPALQQKLAGLGAH